jgi:hypothetical protein
MMGRDFMPVHVEEMTSEVAVFDGELPLTPNQLDKLVRLVLQRLQEKQRETRHSREATTLRCEAAPPMRLDE